MNVQIKIFLFQFPNSKEVWLNFGKSSANIVFNNHQDTKEAFWSSGETRIHNGPVTVIFRRKVNSRKSDFVRSDKDLNADEYRQRSVPISERKEDIDATRAKKSHSDSSSYSDSDQNSKMRSRKRTSDKYSDKSRKSSSNKSKSRDRDRDREKHRDKDQDRDKDGDRRRERDKDRDRDKSRDKDRDRRRETDRDRGVKRTSSTSEDDEIKKLRKLKV